MIESLAARIHSDIMKLKLEGIFTLQRDAAAYASANAGCIVTERTRKDGSKYYLVGKPA